MIHQTVPLVGLIVGAPAWLVGYAYHMIGYRPGGRYDREVKVSD